MYRTSGGRTPNDAGFGAGTAPQLLRHAGRNADMKSHVEAQHYNHRIEKIDGPRDGILPLPPALQNRFSVHEYPPCSEPPQDAVSSASLYWGAPFCTERMILPQLCSRRCSALAHRRMRGQGSSISFRPGLCQIQVQYEEPGAPCGPHTHLHPFTHKTDPLSVERYQHPLHPKLWHTALNNSP